LALPFPCSPTVLPVCDTPLISSLPSVPLIALPEVVDTLQDVDPGQWLEQILTLTQEKGFAKDLLMHSRLVVEKQNYVLYYLDSLSCFMTAAIEMKIRMMLETLSYNVKNLQIKPAAIQDCPQQQLDRLSDQKRQNLSDLFDCSLLGKHLQHASSCWITMP